MREGIPVLIVDDDDDLREMLALVLDAEGFRTSGASNGAEALRLIRDFTGGVVLLDLRMPVMSGWEVIQALRDEGRLARIPIAICTSSPVEAPDGFRVVPKPVDFEHLISVIRALVV